jgi:hypothetical protein
MTEDVTVDASSHLDPVVAHLSERFPDAGPDHVAEVVWDVYNDLSAEAKVPDHLAALTQHKAKERLQAETRHTPA